MLLEPFGGPGRRLPAQPGSSNKWVARGTISSRQIDDLEPALTRHGYDVRTLADRFNVKPIEIKALLAGNPARRAYPRADRSHERRWGPRMKSCRINKERCRVRVSARAFVARFEVLSSTSNLHCVFYKDKVGNIFHTYSTYARGTETGLSGPLTELFNDAVRAYVCGAPAAAFAMCRALLERFLSRATFQENSPKKMN